MEIDIKKIITKPKLFILVCVGMLIFVSIIAIAVFFLSVRGAEQTMVPDVRDKDIIQALLELQQKELYPRIQLRYSEKSDEKNRILEQDPRPGTIVKAGRRIRLVVSRGVLLSSVENYVGRNIDDVRADFQTLFANSPQPLITIKEPVLYQYSEKPQGTVLEQSPIPGTGIFSPIELDLVVSLGSKKETITMPALVGLKITDAIALIDQAGIKFSFSIENASTKQSAETVIAQTPGSGEIISAERTARITVASPQRNDLRNDEVFALFKYKLSENPYPLPTRLDVILPGGERRTLVSVRHLGGDFSFPYRVPANSILVLSVLDREVFRKNAKD